MLVNIVLTQQYFVMLSVKGNEHRAIHGKTGLGILRQEGRSSRITLVTWDTVSKSIKLRAKLYHQRSIQVLSENTRISRLLNFIFMGKS